MACPHSLDDSDILKSLITRWFLPLLWRYILYNVTHRYKQWSCLHCGLWISSLRVFFFNILFFELNPDYLDCLISGSQILFPFAWFTLASLFICSLSELLCYRDESSMWEYLGNTAGSVPDHLNKTNRAIKWLKLRFCFPSAYKSYLFTQLWSIKCTIALCLKNAYTLIKKYFIAEKCCPSSELSASHSLSAGGGSCLGFHGCWLIRVRASEGWGGCGNFLK